MRLVLRSTDGILPHAAADRLVRIAGLGELRFLRLDIAMHVATRGIGLGPHADRILGRCIEVPNQLAGLGVIGTHETADAVLATVGADQNLAVNGSRRHGLAVAQRGIGNVGLPRDGAGFGVERDQFGVEGGEIDLIVIDGDAAVVGAAAIGRDRTHGVLVVPIFLARLGVDRIDVVERRGDVHHAVDDDRRRLHRFLHFGLEDPGGVKLADVGCVDLLAREIAGLIVIAVGVKEVVRITGCGVKLFLRDRSGGRPRVCAPCRAGCPGKA